MNQILLHKDYTINSGTVQLVLPIAVEFHIPANDSVRLLSQVLEELDYTKLYKAYSHQGRNPAVSPKNLFKVLVYGYMSGVITSRALEKACRRDINFMWLLQGQKAPDHNTIARFRSGRVKEAVEDLFHQFVKKLHQLGEISFENLFVDGTKIEACANKYSFVWKKATQKNEVRLKNKARKLLDSLGYSQDNEKPISVEDMKDILKNLQKIKIEKGITFVEGKGKRKTQLQRDIEALESCISLQQKYNNYNALFDGRNSFSKTDTDATFMRMKEDHMRNSQLKPGYNVQIGVEAEYIVDVDISSERSDQLTLIPFMEKMRKAYPLQYKNVIADAGYESEENYVYLKNNGINKNQRNKYKNLIEKLGAGFDEEQKNNIQEAIKALYNDKNLNGEISKRICADLNRAINIIDGHIANTRLMESYRAKAEKSDGVLKAAEIGYSKVKLEWGSNAIDSDIAGNILYRNGKEILRTTSHSINDNDLNSGETYTYEVHGFDAAGNIVFKSNSLTVRTKASFLAVSSLPKNTVF